MAFPIFSVWPPLQTPPKNMAKYHVGEKNDWKGMKKGRKCIFFPQLVKSMHIFSPIDLKFSKLQKKGLEIFFGGKNMIQERGGGQKFEFP